MTACVELPANRLGTLLIKGSGCRTRTSSLSLPFEPISDATQAMKQNHLCVLA